MKKIVRNFFMFLVLFNGIFLQEALSETTINDPQGHFSLQLGSGWIPEQIKDPHHFGRYAYIQGQNKLANLAAGSEKLQAVMTPLQYAQAFEKNLMGMPQYQRLEMKPVNLKGREAIYLQFSGVAPQTGNKLIFEVYVLVFETTSYMMVFNSQAEQFNTLKPVFDRVIQSIQYTPTTSKPTESGITFNDPQGRISLQLGSGWTPLPLQQKGVLGRYHYGQDDREQLVILSEALAQTLSPLEYAQEIEKKELSGITHKKHLEKNVNLGGQEAAYQQFSLVANTPKGETPLMFEVYYFVIQNNGYRIAFSARESQHSTVKPAVDRIIQNIQYRNVSVQKSAPAAQASQKTAPTQSFKDAKQSAIPLEEGQGILHIEIPNWIDKAPYHYRIHKMSDDTEIANVSNALKDTKLPAGDYKIIWRQESQNSDVSLAENVKINSGQTTFLVLNTGFKIVPADWIGTEPYYWELRNSEKNASIRVYQTLKPQLVPPGKYELWYRQHQSENNNEILLSGNVEIKNGELTAFELNTGFRIIPARWITEPYYWELRDPGKNMTVRVYKTFKPQPVPPGNYELWYRQDQSKNTDETRLADGIQIKSGDRIAFDLNTGIKLVPKDLKVSPLYRWVITNAVTNEEVLSAYNTWDPQPIAAGRYKLGIRKTQADDLIETGSEFEVKQGNLMEINI
jgi:hypothetical protein